MARESWSSTQSQTGPTAPDPHLPTLTSTRCDAWRCPALIHTQAHTQPTVSVQESAVLCGAEFSSLNICFPSPEMGGSSQPHRQSWELKLWF